MQGVIFDMDGLLFDTETIWQNTWEQLAKERDIVLPSSFQSEIMGSAGDKLHHILNKYYHVENSDDLYKEYVKRVNQKLETEVPLKEGAKEIIQYFYNQHFPIAIASSSPLSQIEHHCACTGITPYITKMVTGSTLPESKPNPAIFLLAAKELGLKPEECYVFEDALNGVKAGGRAGCKTIMIPDLIAPTEEIKQYCDGIYPSLTIALQAIQKKEI